jgi:hypothetical protein
MKNKNVKLKSVDNLTIFVKLYKYRRMYKKSDMKNN